MTLSPSLVLASASTARARLLVGAGIVCTVDPADVDEERIKREARADAVTAAEAALRLARAKAGAVSPRWPEAFVIAADQMLDCDGRWLDKPKDRADARESLLFLRCRDHHLVSAVTVMRGGSVLWQTADAARLRMRAFSEAFLDDYLDRAGADVCSSVGGCKLEGHGIQFFEMIEGDFFTILGLPLLPLLAFLRQQGVIER